MKQTSKLLLLAALKLMIYCVHESEAKYHGHPSYEEQLKNFTMELEKLVLNTTGRALVMTKNLYTNMDKEMSPQLQQAANMIIQNYSSAVDLVMAKSRNYKERRQMLQQFKYNNRMLEHLRQQMDPLHPSKIQINLLSDEFIEHQRNQTAFDNLYQEFMKEFQRISEQLWQNMSEEFVENNEELLEILDEISKEKQLPEKDKLYDEFIEMYLFKNHNDFHNRQNNELEDLDYQNEN